MAATKYELVHVLSNLLAKIEGIEMSDAVLTSDKFFGDNQT